MNENQGTTHHVAGSGSAPLVLVVEDSTIQAEMLRRLLTGAGYMVETAKDGVEALESIRKATPKLVLSDVNMPRMDGIELCSKIKHDPDLQSLRLILVTTLADPEDVMRGASAGADDYIVKPYNDDYLLSKIERELARPSASPTDDELISTKIVVDGKAYSVAAPPSQLLKLLISTYENASQQNQELIEAQVEMKSLNRTLEANVDELEQSQKALRLSEERYRSLVTLIPDIIYRIDPTGKFEYVNEAVRSLGWEPDELIGQDFGTLLTPEDADRVSRVKVLPDYEGKDTGEEMAPKLFDERRSWPRVTRGLEVRLIGKDGSSERVGEVFSLIGEVSSAGLYGDGDTFLGSVGAVRDITQRKQHEQEIKEFNTQLEARVDDRTRELFVANQNLEKALQEIQQTQMHMIQSEKMAALGTLVAGVAHELNNPLMGAMNYVEHVSKHVGDEKYADFLDKARHEIARATEIVTNMLSFSRTADSSMEQVDISKVIGDTLQLLAADYRHKGIAVTIEIPDDLPAVRAKTTGLQQVILNLLTNARDALDIVDAKNLHISAQLLPGAMVRVSVSDNGPGIPQDVLRRIFDPFFTTKPVGKGTGLGLTVSTNLVRGFGGTMSCDSAEGEGTTFHIDLPAGGPASTE